MLAATQDRENNGPNRSGWKLQDQVIFKQL